ncbi:TMH family membrane protein [Chlamydia abortus]|uniref:TMH-family membrane protein n=2 Tax=Chlamydia abortus TaxID=83555 RepID=Q5L580_CHLAB|nr:IncA family protein [Chlamydia abortus]CAH64214.1 putative TMH-family membrane protein [Chlamydia abortus S26/3]SFW02178.1 TMH family membrane protein [Chlamydia abortus]SFW02395.1 TMH family membrane protein [Chlamydia abortus]SFW02447.1 TMH family membrane protein [Chlamydia abortus]SFW04373.1 TMH family membrane protein [Chlamydia abortus]
MKSVSPCFYLKLENSEDRCCHFSDSRVHFLTTIVSLIASLLIITGAIAAVILFGTQLGVLYSTVIIGVSVAIGVLLFSASLQCFSCPAVVSQSQRFSEDNPRSHIHDSKLSEATTLTEESVEAIERELHTLLSEYEQERLAYECCISQRNLVKISMDSAKEEFDNAYADVQRLHRLFTAEDSNNLSNECQESLSRYREKSIDYARSIQRYEDLFQQMHSHQDLMHFQKIAPIHERVHILLQERDESQTRIRALEDALSLRNRDLVVLSSMDTDLQSSIKKLQNTQTVNQGTIRALQTRLEEVEKNRNSLEEAPFLVIGRESEGHSREIVLPDNIINVRSLEEENEKLKRTLAFYYRMVERMETRFESQSPSMLTETATSQDFLMIANSEEYTRKQVGAMIASYFEDERESQQRELIRLRELSSQQAQEIADLRSGFLRSGDTISEDTNLDIIDMSLEEDTVHNVVVAEDPFFGSP